MPKIPAGAAAIRNKLVELHDKLLGVQVAPDSGRTWKPPTVSSLMCGDASSGRKTWRSISAGCAIGKGTYSSMRESWTTRWSNGRMNTGIPITGLMWIAWMTSWTASISPDPYHTAQAWMVVLAAMLMDHRYLYL